jgi:hypothetical protein
MTTAAQENSATTVGALGGLRVLDLSHGVAAPFAARLLGDFGANVIKLEKPGGGDFARTLEPLQPGVAAPEQSLIFQYLNWNKRSVTLDLREDILGMGDEEIGRLYAENVVSDHPTAPREVDPQNFEQMLRVGTLVEVDPDHESRFGAEVSPAEDSVHGAVIGD